MKHFISISTAFVLIMTFSCTGPKYLEQTRLAGDAYLEMEYQEALQLAEKAIENLPDKKTTEHGQVYAIAGNSAYSLEQYDKAQKYLERARELDYSDETMYLNMAAIYLNIDNLSREITSLEEYTSLFPEGNYVPRAKERLFQTTRESMNYDLAFELWPLLDSTAKTNVENLELYLTVNKSIPNDSICDLTAANILEIDPKNESALKWFAMKYYWIAEKRYQAEMEAYEKNKTMKQYNILLKAFKVVTADFKKSLDYFTKLYKVNPDPNYARFLGNVYARLGDEETAKTYHRKGGGN
jgi:tetratricopeptide (TPR) repeat protein